MVEDKRAYRCRGCGHILFETDVPLGTEGRVYAVCKNRSCHEYNPVGIGAPPVGPKVWTEWRERALHNGHVNMSVTTE